MNYHNENDTKTAAWLLQLITDGHLPAGLIDTRSIADVQPSDVRGHEQCHFFAGIGGWPLALRLAGWPSDRPVWTGSCPCQPFSAAGKRRGGSDDRHLWPAWFTLIRACRPQYVFGEQVAAAIGFGWVDGVFADLEAEGYTCGQVVWGAHSVGAPHIRQRLYWVAIAKHTIGRPFGGPVEDDVNRNDAGREETHGKPGACSKVRGLAVSDGGRRAGRPADCGWPAREDAARSDCRVGDPESGGRREYGDAAQPGSGGYVDGSGPWGAYTVRQCLDGKARRIPREPAFHPLAHGVPDRVVRLRGYGNAIVPALAAQFIQDVMTL